MPSNSVVKAKFKKNVYAKSIDLQKKKKLFTSWIQTHDLLNASQLLYPLSYTAVVFNGMLLEFSPLLRLQPAAEHNLITAFNHGDNPEK